MPANAPEKRTECDIRHPQRCRRAIVEFDHADVQVHPTLEALEDVLADLFQAVDNRVYIAVGRGLWDCASQDVYDYLEGLQEGLGLNKVLHILMHHNHMTSVWPCCEVCCPVNSCGETKD